MVTAIVLLQVRRDRIQDLAQELADIEGVSEVYSVSGRYDLAAVVRVSNNEKMADVVTGHMLKMDGIERTETLLAFRAFSRHDLENMFAIGME